MQYWHQRAVDLAADNANLKLLIGELEAELAAARAELAKATDGLRELLGVYADVAQLFDGWHCDIAWSEWDSQVRQRMIGAQHTAAEAVAAAEKARKS